MQKRNNSKSSIWASSLVLAGVILALGLPACGGGGACLVDSPTGRGGWEVCYDDWSADECWDTYSENSCAELGFIKKCRADDRKAFRKSSYSC